jgi:hypothetical protein
MDMKSYFLNEELEEVYIEQVVPTTWYSRLDKYVQHAWFIKGSENNNLYIKVNLEICK